jgi:hypothetical protein
MKRILTTVTMIMVFGLTAYASHTTKATGDENISAQPHTITGHPNVSRHGHPNLARHGHPSMARDGHPK